ncbi:uncharacterized protein LOC127130156 [Lathyrus oleraceus]|uniref:uncharacterized protein LOC127130156 n=1 Tax=Pisum sativum TaxID=3888 RepID=UPI0021CDEFBB|nr:uncharacterized protein LOC127130156 [Pisum sativum]
MSSKRKTKETPKKIITTKASRKPPLTPKKRKQKEPQIQITDSDEGDLSPDTTKPTKKRKKQIKTFDTLSHPKIKATKVSAKKSPTSKEPSVDREPPTTKTPEQRESDNSSPEDEDSTKQSNITQIIPISSSDLSYHPTSTPSYHPISPKDSTKESTEVGKPIEDMHKDQADDSKHGNEEENNTLVEGEADEEMQDAGDIVENIIEDGSPTIGNKNTDSPYDEEEEDRSMSAEDEDEDQENVPQDEQNKNVPKTKATSDVSIRTMATSTRNIGALSLEELEALKMRKPLEYLKVIMSERVVRLTKAPILQQRQVANLPANMVMNYFSRLNKRP